MVRDTQLMDCRLWKAWEADGREGEGLLEYFRSPVQVLLITAISKGLGMEILLGQKGEGVLLHNKSLSWPKVQKDLEWEILFDSS